MAAEEGYLPPVVVEVTGTDRDLVGVLAEAKALLAEFAKTVTTTQLGADSVPFQATLATAKTELLSFAKEVSNTQLGATATPFWSEIAALRAEMAAMSPVDIDVDANIAQALAEIAVLKGALADAQTAAMLTPDIAGINGNLAGWGGAGGEQQGGNGVLDTLSLASMLGIGGGGGAGARTWLGAAMGALPAMGTLAGLAGFSAEGVLGTTLGVSGSLAGAGLGAGFLGLGMAGTGAVGMGTDMAGIGQAMGDMKTYSQLQGNMAQASAVYGKTSTEFKLAQYQYTQWAQDLSKGTIQAIASADKMATAFHAAFDKVTGDAETTGAQIITQAMKVGMTFLPTIGKFAAQNMGIIKSSLQPFFTWLDTAGKSGGLGIFTNLEHIFQSELPTGMHAAEQGFELLAKTIDIAAQSGGKFITWINQFLTRMNGATFGKWSKFVTDMIGLFEAWFPLLVKIGKTLMLLFEPAVGLGKQLAQLLTSLFTEIDNWLSQTGTKNILHGLFTAHASELIKGFGGLLQALLPIIGAFLDAFLLIETAFRNFVAIPVLTALTQLIDLLDRIPGVAPAIGAFFAAWVVYARAFTPLVNGVKLFTAGLGGAEVAESAASSAFYRLGSSLSSFLTFLRLIPTGIGKAVSGIGSFVASIGKGVVALGAFVAGQFGVEEASTAMTVSLGLLSSVGVIALAVGIYELVQHFGALRTALIVGAAGVVALGAAFIFLDVSSFGILPLIGLIASAIAALVAGIVELATHWQQVWSDIKGWIDDAWRDIQGKGNNIIGLLLDIWSGGLLLLAAHWSTVWNGIQAIAGAVGSWFTGPFVNFFIDMGHDIESAWDAVTSFFEGLPSTIEGYFSDAGSWLIQAGKDIINGLIKGLKDAVGDLVTEAQSVGHAVLGAVKGVLGIFSPSTAMQSVGNTTMSGLTNGINSGSKETVAAATQAAQAIVQAFGSVKNVQADTSAIGSIRQMFTSLSGALKSLSSIAGQASALNFGADVQAIQALSASIPTLASALQGLAPAFQGLGKLTGVTKDLSQLQTAFTHLKNVLKTLTAIVQASVKTNIPVAFFAMDVAIAQITAALPNFLNGLHGLQLDIDNMAKIKTSTKALTTLEHAFSSLTDFLKQLTTTVGKVAGVNIPQDFFVMDMAFTLVAAAIPTFASALTALKQALDKLGQITVTTKGLTKLKGAFKTFGTAITAMNATVIIIAGTNIPANFQVLGTAASQIASGLKTVWGKIKSDSSSTWKAIADYIKKVTTTVLTPLKNLATKAGTVGTDLKKAWTKVLSDMHTTWGSIVSYMQGIPGKLESPFQGIKTKFIAFGLAMMSGIQTGINQGIAGIVTAMQHAITQAVTAAKNAAQIKSPSGLTRAEIGRPLAQGTALGILDELSTIRAASQSMIGASIPGLRGLPSGIGGEGAGYGAIGNTELHAHLEVIVHAGPGTNGTKVGQQVIESAKTPLAELVQRLAAGTVR